MLFNTTALSNYDDDRVIDIANNRVTENSACGGGGGIFSLVSVDHDTFPYQNDIVNDSDVDIIFQSLSNITKSNTFKLNHPDSVSTQLSLSNSDSDLEFFSPGSEPSPDTDLE